MRALSLLTVSNAGDNDALDTPVHTGRYVCMYVGFVCRTYI